MARSNKGVRGTDKPVSGTYPSAAQWSASVGRQFTPDMSPMETPEWAKKLKVTNAAKQAFGGR